MTENRRLRHSQSGIVSLLVSMAIMILVTLIVISFAFLVRRESRQSLDRQLSTQAFYAAESGLEDARDYLKANPNFTKTDCANTPGYTTQLPNYNNQLDVAAGTSYSCVLIKPDTPSIVYDNLPQDVYKPILIQSASAISTVTISWEKANITHGPAPTFISNSMSANHYLPKGTAGAGNVFTGTSAGMLRAATTIPPAGNWNASNLLSGTAAYYLYPNGGSTSTVDTGAADADFVDGNCGTAKLSAPVSAPLYCEVKIPLNIAANARAYLSLMPLYESAHVIITAQNALGTDVSLTGQQILVDVTGKANDVLRRIQARVPISEATSRIPGYALSTTEGFCKRFAAWPVGTSGTSGFADGCVAPTGGSSSTWADPPKILVGTADYETCNGVCNSSGGGGNTTVPSISYYRDFRNTTAIKSGLTIVGCTWYWDDGSSPEIDIACQPGESRGHTFNAKAADTVCQMFNTRLTIRYNTGPPADSYQTVSLPHGLNAPSGCPIY